MLESNSLNDYLTVIKQQELDLGIDTAGIVLLRDAFRTVASMSDEEKETARQASCQLSFDEEFVSYDICESP